MGETPARAGRIISSGEFDERLLDFEGFAKAAGHKNAVVIDIRDPFQRALIPRIPGVRNIPLDPLLDLVVSRIWTEKHLLFFDAVGKQVRWLQYFLESYGYFDYALSQGAGSGPSPTSPTGSGRSSRPTGPSSAARRCSLTLTADTRLDNSDRKVLSYLLANVKFNNYIVVDLQGAGKDVEMTRALLLNSVRKLTRLKYATHSIMQDTLIVQVDPRLAWKGKVGSKVWKDKMAEFDTTVKH